ncbi:MAG: triose-phosphate isomerase [Desulfobulbus sp.]|nr:triose-phosphate isomerase [Desulfobulbus sp.]
MNRRPLIAGNWKMYLTGAEAVRLAQAVAATSGACLDRDVMVAPAFTALAKVCEAVRDTPLQVAAQNVAWGKEGAYTGEISPIMLADLGVRLAIVGHSERRQIFGERDAMINRRLLGALAGDLQPVLCVGETLEEREADHTFSVLEQQMRQCLQGVAKGEMRQMILAYEPVWAIGTGKTATKEQAQEVHAFLRRFLAEAYEKSVADEVRILYGGSVKPENIDSLMAQSDIDGALVGGAALNAESFDRIIRFQ